jgi:hypothetical protein
MTLSDPTDTQPAVKQARKCGRSAEEKRQQSEERVQRHRSTTAGTAQADTARENHRLRMQRSRVQSKLITTITARFDSFRRSNDGRAESATPTNDGRIQQRFRVSAMYSRLLQCVRQLRVDRMRQCQQR